jgi:very-short-patch-repair endonuclease
MTLGERAMHEYLRALRMLGAHFRREVPIGPYIVDFAWLSARIAIEVDGASHDLPGRAETDAARDRSLRSQGFQVIRVCDADVIANAERAFAPIEEAMRPYLTAPPPAASRLPPPHKGEGVAAPSAAGRRKRPMADLRTEFVGIHAPIRTGAVALNVVIGTPME